MVAASFARLLVLGCRLGLNFVMGLTVLLSRSEFGLIFAFQHQKKCKLMNIGT